MLTEEREVEDLWDEKSQGKNEDKYAWAVPKPNLKGTHHGEM